MYERVYVTKFALEVITEETAKTQNKMETGGVLMGYYSRKNEVVITYASPPGPNAVQKKRSIEFNTIFCQSFIDKIFTESNGYFSYLGDWHSHTLPIIKPSFTDKLELRRTARSQKSRLPKPVMGIVYGDGRHLECGFFGYSEDHLYQVSHVILLN